jgi:hypothetical protein
MEIPHLKIGVSSPQAEEPVTRNDFLRHDAWVREHLANIEKSLHPMEPPQANDTTQAIETVQVRFSGTDYSPYSMDCTPVHLISRY